MPMNTHPTILALVRIKVIGRTVVAEIIVFWGCARSRSFG